MGFLCQSQSGLDRAIWLPEAAGGRKLALLSCGVRLLSGDAVTALEVFTGELKISARGADGARSRDLRSIVDDSHPGWIDPDRKR